MTLLLISCFLLPKLIIKSYKIVIRHIQTQSKSSIELEGLSFCYPKNRGWYSWQTIFLFTEQSGKQLFGLPALVPHRTDSCWKLCCMCFHNTLSFITVGRFGLLSTLLGAGDRLNTCGILGVEIEDRSLELTFLTFGDWKTGGHFLSFNSLMSAILFHIPFPFSSLIQNE